MNLTTATPVEIDTALASIYARMGDAEFKVESAKSTVHHWAGDRRVYLYGRGVEWSGTFGDALAVVAEIAATDTTYKGNEAKRALSTFEAATAAVEALTAEAAPLNAEYRRRGGWTRAFLATSANGHVHNGMNCSTCNKMGQATRFAWFPEYSGRPEAEIVADAGERACTTCYPSAPIDVLSRPTKMFSEVEKAKAVARDERAAAKVARDAKRVAKGLTADGSEFVIKYVEQNAGRLTRNAQGQQVHSYGPVERTEYFKTEQSAVQWVVRYAAWGSDLHASDKAVGFAQVIAAVAAKHGKSVAEVTADIEAKVAAKIKRDSK